MLNILSNPLVVLLAATLIITIGMFLFVGRKKKPKKKIEKAIDKKNDENKVVKSEEENIEKTQKTDELSEKLAQINEKFNKVDENSENQSSKNEKKITKVYVRKPSENINSSVENEQQADKYDDLSGRAEFVSTSKKISKFEKFSSGAKLLNAEAQEFKEDIENCEVCHDLISHFDHSRRISKCVKDDNFDNLFASHITEHYLKIDAERHLTRNEIDILKRADEVVENGQNRALDPESQEIYNNLKRDKDKLRFWLEQRKADEDFSENKEKNEMSYKLPEISLGSLIVSDAVLNRKKRHK